MRRLPLLLMVLGLAACALVQPPQAAKRYFVFFNEWSAEPESDSAAIIRTAAAYATAHPRTTVTVTGYADPTGSAKANVDLSAARAQRVVDALEHNGVPAARIRRNAHGILPYKWSAQESRRVDIAISD